jgi:hypothetical protein
VSHLALFDAELTFARKPDDPEKYTDIYGRKVIELLLLMRDGDDMVLHRKGEHGSRESRLPDGEGTELT